jgi:predicted Zn-dependent protease
MGLAQACNQLAWLLANCNAHLDEAIYLSGRSLEIDPDSYAYLDTMSRCQFAAGRLKEAVDYQRRAVAKAPHDRMLNAQLAEIEAALRQQQSSPDATIEEDK